MRKLQLTFLFAALIIVCSAPVWATSGTLTITTTTSLTEDHQGNIVIAENGLTLDCDGHTVMGDGSGTGIQLIGRVGVTVKNCRVTNFQKGFVVAGSARNVFKDNRVERNADEAFDLNGAIGNLFIENIANNNDGDGFDLDDSNENIFKRNDTTQNGRNGFELDNSHKNIFEDNSANNNGRLSERSGFSLDNSRANIFEANIADGNSRSGFLIEISPDNTFIENRACGNRGAGRGGLDVFQDTTSFRNIFLDNAFCSDNLPVHVGFPGDKGFVLPGD
jgi:parallel beta-helix repeat protein